MKALLLTALFTLTVTTASAQSVATLTGGIGTLAGLIDGFTGTVVRSTGGLFMALAMIAFFYGVVEYIWGARQGDGDRVKRGNQFLTWSLVALFVMFSVYGIIRFGQRIVFGDADVSRIVVPRLDFGTGSSNPNTSQPSANPPTNTGLPSSGGAVYSNEGRNNTGTPEQFNRGAAGEAGASCQFNSDCNGALQCRGGMCTATNGGVTGGREDCDSSERWDPVTRTCI